MCINSLNHHCDILLLLWEGIKIPRRNINGHDQLRCSCGMPKLQKHETNESIPPLFFLLCFCFFFFRGGRPVWVKKKTSLYVWSKSYMRVIRLPPTASEMCHQIKGTLVRCWSLGGGFCLCLPLRWQTSEGRTCANTSIAVQVCLIRPVDSRENKIK